MRRPEHLGRRLRAALVLTPLLLPVPGSSVAWAADEPTDFFLEYLINEEPSGFVVETRHDGGRWCVAAEELAVLRIRSDDLRVREDGRICLDGIPGLAAVYDATYQRMSLAVATERRMLNELMALPDALPGDAARGVLMNYDVLLEQQERASFLRGQLEQRVFRGGWVLRNFGLVGGEVLGGGSPEGLKYRRLDTALVFADPNRIRTVTAGDTVTRSLGWTRSVRLGGLSLRRDFALRPDLVTYPVPDFTGAAAVPSAVDIYVNQARQFSGEVPAGPFRINAPPAVTGAGQATVVVRDALGRDEVRTVDLYIVPELLDEGLTDYALEFGWLRRGYGQESFGYEAAPAFSASLRRGLTSYFTGEAHAEGNSEFVAGGLGTVLRLGLAGRVNGALALSQRADDLPSPPGGAVDGSGWLANLGYEYRSRRWRAAVDWQRTAPGYTDLARLGGGTLPRSRLNLSAGLQPSANTQFSLGYFASQGHSEDSAPGVAPQRNRLLTLAARQNVGAASLFVNVFNNFAGGQGVGVFTGLSLPFGRTVHSQLTHASEDDRTSLSVSSNTPTIPGWDWNLQVSEAADARRSRSFVRHSGRRTELELRTVTDGSDWRVSGGARGSLAVMDGALVFGRFAPAEFAVVSTERVPGVRVLQENRAVGETNGAGLMLLPNVNAYQPNRVSIDPLSVPDSVAVRQTASVGVPRFGAGTLVRFELVELSLLEATVLDAAGEPLPPGTPFTVAESGEQGRLGYDGYLYLERAAATNTVTLGTATGTCVVALTKAAAKAETDGTWKEVRCP